jgi:hypothetical protein
MAKKPLEFVRDEHASRSVLELRGEDANVTAPRSNARDELDARHGDVQVVKLGCDFGSVSLTSTHSSVSLGVASMSSGCAFSGLTAGSG